MSAATDTLDRYEEQITKLTRRMIEAGEARQLPDGSIVLTPAQWANYIIRVAAIAANIYRPKERVH